MYAPSYAFGPGPNSQPFNPNGIPHNIHQQQQQQQPGQPQMMYNPQQYAANASHQSPYGGGPGPGMGPNAGGMGMMQNNGLAHMGGGHGMFVPRSRDLLDYFSSSLLSATSALHFFMLCACPDPHFNRRQATPTSCGLTRQVRSSTQRTAHNQVSQSTSTSH